MLANRAVKEIKGLFMPQRMVRDLWRKEDYLRAVSRYLWPQQYSDEFLKGLAQNEPWAYTAEAVGALRRNIWWKRAARIGGAIGALDVAGDLLSRGPGGLIYDEYGRFNISGVPFI